VVEMNCKKPHPSKSSQRGGRNARGKDEVGYVLTLAPPSWSDKVRRETDERAAVKSKKRKRTAVKPDDDNDGGGSKPKKARKSAFTGSDAYLEENYHQSDEQLRQKYKKNAQEQVDGGSKNGVLDAVMDDYYNARERGFKCRRHPLNIAYDNDKRSTHCDLHTTHVTDILNVSLEPSPVRSHRPRRLPSLSTDSTRDMLRHTQPRGVCTSCAHYSASPSSKGSGQVRNQEVQADEERSSAFRRPSCLS
jgi:hypothetical protein